MKIFNWLTIEYIDLLAPVRYAFLLWLGFTGRVDWWILVAIFVWSLEIRITFK